MGYFPDFAQTANQGIVTGQKMAEGQNPLGNFVKMMLSEFQRKKVAQEEYGQKIGLINAEAEARSKYPSVLEKAIASQAGGEEIKGLEGMETVGYDQKGNPMIRKIKRNVQGEKFDIEQGEKKQRGEEIASLARETAQSDLDTITEIEKGMGNFGIQGIIPAFPGTSKSNWQANIDKLLSSKIIEVMTDMKTASKTGATGFGQLSNKELEVLRQSSTQLKKTLSPQDAKRYLEIRKEKLQKILQSNSQINPNDAIITQYMDKYPDRSREEIISTMQKQGMM